MHCKFFTPDSNWTWPVTEGLSEDDDFLFFGYVIGLEEEWGYFVLSELESVRGPLGQAIERDLHFQPGPFSEVIERYAENGDTECPQGRRQLLLFFVGCNVSRSFPDALTVFSGEFLRITDRELRSL